MLLHFSFSPFISFLLLLIIFWVDIPFSFSANDDSAFSVCSRSTYECGAITNITYPFWGNDRPYYCGDSHEYELSCRHNSTEILIGSLNYRVLNISLLAKILTIAPPIGIWTDNCPSNFGDFFLTTDMFYINSTTRNLTLYYGCPSIPQLTPTNVFNCSTNKILGENYFWDHYSTPPDDLSKCYVNVSIILPTTSVERFTSHQSTVEDVLRKGFEMSYYCRQEKCDQCEESGGQCGNDDVCHCVVASGTYGTCGSRGAKISIIIITAPSIVFPVFIAAFIFLHWWVRKIKKKTQRLMEDFLKNYESIAPRRYSFSDLKKITNSFKDKIGEGGFGGVYKGKLLNGRLVAVKLLHKAKNNGEDFVDEVASICRTSHVNIVGFLGFCYEGSKRALIYEFMPNGSLEKYIYDRNALEVRTHLGWEALYQIATGVARGLEYLHRGCNTRILHFDIKPHNILLDQDFTPKISDFGLAKLCPRKESIVSMVGTRGTRGYIAPEVFDRNFGDVSNKSDVYSYGMMVLEMVGRRKNIDTEVDHTSAIYFPDWIYRHLIVDENLGSQKAIPEEEEITKKMTLVALWCIQTNPMDRPAMHTVVEMLEGKHEVLTIPPPPYLCSSRAPLDSSDA